MWKSVRRKEFSKSADKEVSFFATSFKVSLGFINYEDKFLAFFDHLVHPKYTPTLTFYTILTLTKS